MPTQRVIIYTDGACRGNPGPGGWAAVLLYRDVRKILSGSTRFTTNNRMELMAAIEGLTALKRSCAVELFTDSEYLRKGIKIWLPRWKKHGFRTMDGGAVKNQDLWLALERAVNRHKVQWKWVRGHSDSRYNDLCDKLAKEALELGLNPSNAALPARKDKRSVSLRDARLQVVEVEVFPTAWASGAMRQITGRLRRRRSLPGKMKYLRRRLPTRLETDHRKIGPLSHGDKRTARDAGQETRR